MAKHHGVDPYSMEGLLHRHENRQLLLQRLSTVRQQIKDLEREAGIFEEWAATHGRGFSESVKALGSRGVARGFGLSFAWAAPQGAIRMASYETSKDSGEVLWGGISGALAAWLTTPFDVIKTRVMTATAALTFGEALRSVGPTGLFAGAGPRSAWWFCVSSVFFGTYERLRLSFQQKLE
eukprot:Skav217603  [mRNA]  locus=scaffold2172:19179:23430:+ [translate_table: standard]